MYLSFVYPSIYFFICLFPSIRSFSRNLFIYSFNSLFIHPLIPPHTDGFRKVMSSDSLSLKGDKEDLEFAHQYFVRGQECLIEAIKRKVSVLFSFMLFLESFFFVFIYCCVCFYYLCFYIFLFSIITIVFLNNAKKLFFSYILNCIVLHCTPSSPLPPTSQHEFINDHPRQQITADFNADTSLTAVVPFRGKQDHRRSINTQTTH